MVRIQYIWSLTLGRIAHQVVDHVHFHVIFPFPSRVYNQIIPKPDNEQGLGIGWPAKESNKAELQSLLDEIKLKL